jgi:hypothetical protein
MIAMQRYSEPYTATGAIAAVGVLNQLGRPDIDALEVLVREAVQNCWDAKRPDEPGIRVEIGRCRLSAEQSRFVQKQLLTDPPEALPLGDVLHGDLSILYFADFGTAGLGGPTRADKVDRTRPTDFVDFVRNIGQPPDKEYGGGSYGFGKAAFYLASGARTVLIDTLCEGEEGSLQRRVIGCGLGEKFDSDDRPFTGRHWWGRSIDGIPEPLTGDEAVEVARSLGLPDREGLSGLGTTIVVMAPRIEIEGPDGSDATMEFITEALLWNFWPRMTSARGGVHATMRFTLSDDGRRITVPDPRLHPRLRGFVEAIDRLHEGHERDPLEVDDPFTTEVPIECLKPIRQLGRLVVQRQPTAPVPVPERPVPQGAAATAGGLHHVALMRNAELVVKYLSGPAPVTGRIGYCGVFRCALDLDRTFRRAEPPTHDDWIPTFLEPGHDRTFVKVALQRISRVCRDAAGYDTTGTTDGVEDGIPLGEFADSLATLMPAVEGPGARRDARRPSSVKPRRRSSSGAPGAEDPADGAWVDGEPGGQGGSPPMESDDPGNGAAPAPAAPDEPRRPPPRIRSTAPPALSVDGDGRAVVVYPFELRTLGNRVTLAARVEVMTNDGAQVEQEPPVGQEPPEVQEWIDPNGAHRVGPSVDIDGYTADGAWAVVVPLTVDAMMRVDVIPTAT